MSILSTLKTYLLAGTVFIGVLGIAAFFKAGPYKKLLDSPCYTVGVVLDESNRLHGRVVLHYYYQVGNREYKGIRDVYSFKNRQYRKFLVVYCCDDPEISFMMEEESFPDSMVFGKTLKNYEISDLEIPFMDF